MSIHAGKLLKESTREYFTEAAAKKDEMLEAYRFKLDASEARLKTALEESAQACC